MIKFLPAIIIGVFVVLCVIFLLSESANTRVKKFKYFLIALLIGLGFGILWFIPALFSLIPSTSYIVVQVLTLILGIWLIRFVFIDHFQKFNRPILSSFTLLGSTIFFAWIIGGIITYYVFKGLDVYVYLGSAFIIGFFPLLFSLGFDNQEKMPEPYFKFFEWPDGSLPINRDYIDMQNVAIVSIEYRNNLWDEEFIEAQFKAPYQYYLKDYFYDFVREMNQNMPDGEISIQDEYDNFYKWLFYVKPDRFWKSKRYLDPDKSLKENELNDYCTIVFERLTQDS